MIKASGGLQDLRSRLYGRRKAEWPWCHATASDGRGGVVDGGSGHLDLGDGSSAVLESDSNRIGRINLAAKGAGARSAGRSSRQGCHPAGESPALSSARFGQVAMPHPGLGNQPGDAWCKRPGHPVVRLRWERSGGLASVGA
jgi:hypothetical protein